MYFLGNIKGWRGQNEVWKLIQSSSLQIYDLGPDNLKRMASLMEKYADVPMDFADASLVAAAEDLKTNKIFTLDSDFKIYRINGRKHFEIVP